MSVASSSSLRILRVRSAAPTSIRYASTSTESYNPTYIPRPYSRNHGDSVSAPPRPPRPSSPVFFTGRPSYFTVVSELEAMLKSVQSKLRDEYLYPLPRQLSLPAPPNVLWKTRDSLVESFGEKVSIKSYQQIVDLLNETHRIALLADLGGKTDLADSVYTSLAKYSKKEIERERIVKKEAQLDAFGRAHGAGTRKEASAQVWIIPSQSALHALDVPADRDTVASVGKDEREELPSGQFLVNQLPLPLHFDRPTVREKVLRPLRLTGLLGAYNVFALVQGGGNSGQAGAIALALARALVVMRKETKDVLTADGALYKDPRQTERKKTNLLKARAARAWVKR